jgi:hypothetical protein
MTGTSGARALSVCESALLWKGFEPMNAPPSGAERQAVHRAVAWTPVLHWVRGGIREEARAPPLSALVPLVVPGAAFQRKAYEPGHDRTVQSVAEVLKPSWPLPLFAVKSPFLTKSVTFADSGELVSNNRKSVPVVSDLLGPDRSEQDFNLKIMAKPLICTVKARDNVDGHYWKFTTLSYGPVEPLGWYPCSEISRG